MTPEFAEALLNVLNDNAAEMARHIQTGQSVILKPLPNPLDYREGAIPMMEPQEGPSQPIRLANLISREHQLNITVSITLLANDDYLNDASKRMIEEELNEHLARALAQRNMSVLNIDEWRVEFS